MSTGYGWEGIRQICATLFGAHHVPERLWRGIGYTWGAIQVFDLYLYLWSLATWSKRPSLRLRTMYETSNRPARRKTSSLGTKSWQLNVHDPPLIPYTERIQYYPIGLYEGPGLRALVWVTRTCSTCGASWEYWACFDSRYSPVFSLQWPQVQRVGYISVRS